MNSNNQPEESFVPVSAGKVRTRLDELVSATDQWFDNFAPAFDPFRGPGAQKREIRSKAFAEAAHLLYVAEHYDGEGPSELRDLLVRRCNDEDFYRQLLRNPDELTRFGFPLLYVRTIDKLDDDPRRVLDEVIERAASSAAGLPPARQLDFWHFYRIYGKDDHGIDYQQLLDHGYVDRDLNPASANHHELFGLTHEFLYYHNLGCKTAAFPDGPLAYEYPAVFTGSILRYMVEGHVDLVTELLLCGVLQRQVSSGFVRFTLGWLLEHVTDDGCLTFPIDDIRALERIVGPDIGVWEGQSRTWRVNYHPTIAVAILGRVLSDHWSAVRAADTDRSIDYEHERENLLALGRAFASFAEYKLDSGLEHLLAVADTETAAVYDDVVQHAIRFLESQQRDDGAYGVWFDEKLTYQEQMQGNAEIRFEEELLAPLSERCEQVLDAVKATDESVTRD